MDLNLVHLWFLSLGGRLLPRVQKTVWSMLLSASNHYIIYNLPIPTRLSPMGFERKGTRNSKKPTPY